MQNYKSKIQNRQILSNESRAVEVSTSIAPLLTNFFDGSSFDAAENTLSNLLQAYISPDPDSVHSNLEIANTVFAVREITNLLRKLEAINNQLEGGIKCA